ncbi:MAG: hypothetical protein RIB79_07120 [Allomuricauda sp.]|jgi:hypothetical protein
MAYSEHQIERIDHIFKQKNIPAIGKKFMGGYCFFLDDKMCVGIDIDKKTGKDRLMARIGEEAMEEALTKQGCRPICTKFPTFNKAINQKECFRNAALARWKIAPAHTVDHQPPATTKS